MGAGKGGAAAYRGKITTGKGGVINDIDVGFASGAEAERKEDHLGDASKVLVLKISGHAIPAPDVLHETLPLLRIQSLAGHTVASTERVLHFSANRPPHRAATDDLQYAPPLLAAEQRGRRSQRPAVIDTFQGGAMSPGLSTRRLSGVQRTPSIQRTPSRESMSNAIADAPHGTLELVWYDVHVDLESCGSQFLIESRSSGDDALLACSSGPINLSDLISTSEVSQMHQVVMLAPDTDSDAQLGDLADIFRNEAGRLELYGVVLSKNRAQRRRAAFDLAITQKLFTDHLDELDAEGNSPLLRAVRDKKYISSKLLIAAGANSKLRNFQGHSAYDASEDFPAIQVDLRAVHGGGWEPLMAAAHASDIESVTRLIAHGAEVDALNDAGESAFSLASWQGHVEAMRLLQIAGAEVDVASSGGYTCLMKVAALGHLETAKHLARNGASVDKTRLDGSTALFDAAAHGHAALVKVLLAYSANIEARRSDGATPLVVAIGGGSVCCETVDLLLQAGASPNVRFELTDCTAALIRRKQDLEMVKDASTFPLQSGQGEQGVTPLMRASWKGYFRVCDLLLRHKAQIDTQSASGFSALVGAVGNGHAPIVSLLLHNSADLGVADCDGVSPLDQCVNLARPDIHAIMQLAAQLPDLTIASRRKYAAQRTQRESACRSRRHKAEMQAAAHEAQGDACSQSTVPHSRAISRAPSRANSPRAHF